jgi:endonuclease/exonuclease/phosphatase family metal-dependent hydrolase
MVDAYSVYKAGSVPVNTFNGFGKEKNKALRIDYIFGNSTVKFNKYELVRSKHNGHFISDHFPILAEATF